MSSTGSDQSNGSTPNKQSNTSKKGNDNKKGPGRPRNMTNPDWVDHFEMMESLSQLNLLFDILGVRSLWEFLDEEPEFNKPAVEKRKRDDDDDDDTDQHRNKAARV